MATDSSPEPLPTSAAALAVNLITKGEAELAARFERAPSVAMMTLGALLLSAVVLLQVLVEANVITSPYLSHLSSFEFAVAMVAGLILLLGGAWMRAYAYKREIEFDMMRFEKGAELLKIAAETGQKLTEPASNRPSM
jgi:hypothetical protein